MSIETTLEAVARLYPAHMVAGQLLDVHRIAFNIRLALNGAEPRGLSICDIGGGVGLYSLGCAALGMRSMLIDDFGDQVNIREGDAALAVHRKYGVTVLARDVVAKGVADIGEPFDIVTIFDSMEHWHHSPKRLFAEVREKLLKPGGRFVLGVPNCVNLRKRITVPLGYGKWTSMEDWYEQPVFRSHVREPDVDDLRYIARDMRLKKTKILGRNWLAYVNSRRTIRVIAPVADAVLRPFPGLCSDIYLVGYV